MLLSSLFPLFLTTVVFGLKQKQLIPDVPPYQLCGNNVNNTYFVVGTYGSKNTEAPVTGVYFSQAQAACEYFGYRLANLTEYQLEDITNLLTSCNAGGKGWLDIYEGLSPPFNCFGLYGASSLVFSNSTRCGNGGVRLKAICQVADDIVETFSTVTSTTMETTSTSTSFSTTFETDTTVITDYEFVRVTSTITEGTYDVTCITSTKTIVHTVHKRPHHHHHDSSSSSSSSRWFKKSVPKGNGTPVEKSVQKAEVFVACTASINDFFLVENQDIGNSATAQDACNAIGYSVANVTESILDNLIVSGFFSNCTANVAVAGYWYGYEPLGCLQVGIDGVDFIEDPYGDDYIQSCLNQRWALCRAGPAVTTTSTIQTNGFTTLSPVYTETITETSLSIIDTDGTTTETVTETSTDTTIFFTNASLTTITTTDSTSTKTHTRTICSTTTVCGRN